VQEGLIPQTFWDYSEVGHTQEAKQEYLRILEGEEVFTTPKPVALITRILEIATSPKDVVLDSFAGSGTTGHAVLEMNNIEKSDRQFVIVQMPFDTKDQEKKKIDICQRITAKRMQNAIRGYSFTRRMGKGRTKKEKADPLGGSFTYARLGEPILGEYREFGKKLPKWEELARYIFYTETSRDCDPKAFDPKSGFIGSTDAAGGTSYYLLYTPNQKEDCELSVPTLAAMAKRDKNKTWVIYCEKIWLHQEQLRRFEREKGVRVRAMLVPFGLK
jgi:hypothetical protein